MSTSNPQRQMCLLLGALLGPAALTQFGSAVLPSGPRTSHAATVDPAAAVVATATPPPTEAQKKAAARAAELGALAFPTGSPMFYPSEAPAPAPQVSPVAAPAEAPTIVLSSVFKTQEGEAAIIGGKIYKVGDALSDGWTLTGADISARTITITHTDGRSVTVERQSSKRRK